MTIHVKAIGHRVVVKPYTLEEHDPMIARAKDIGLQLLDQDERRLQTGVDRGIVLEVGPNAFTALNQGCDDIPWCKTGDLIAYTKNAGKFIEVSTGKYVLVINDEDVVTVLEEKE